MRIIASNPDSIGDVVLRQPLYESLRAAGHDLTLIVRQELLPLMGVIAPGARVLALPIDPYHQQVDPARLEGLFSAIAAWDPELLLVAPFQWTLFEERLAEAFPEVPRVGMTGKLYPGDPRCGVRNESRMALGKAVEVSEVTPERRKNELLCGAVLGRSLELPPPRLKVTEAQIAGAQAVLRPMGLESEQYWVACVGDNVHTRVRNWRTANWGRVLSYWAKTYGRRFLLVGTEAEAETGREAIAAMDRESRASAVMAEGLDLETLLGVLSLSRGYIGRDTGPMHMAAAMGKPVLAVFGGGTWPRFGPAVEPSRVLTVGVPCTGCDWICHLPNSYCVKEVAVEQVITAIDDMEQGRIHGAEVVVTPVDRMLEVQMLQESAIATREARFQAAKASRERDALSQRVADAEQVASEAVARRTQLQAEREALSQRVTDAERVASEAIARQTQLQAERDVLSQRVTDTEQMASEAVALQARLQAEQTKAADLKLMLARVRNEHEMLAACMGQATVEAEELRKRARKLAVRLERLERSKWYRLGGMLGLKLESAAGVNEATPKRPMA